ncbi:hypothetical protein [Paraburkholderia kururiensis]|uniref:Uncharacterized protein n=1 Tax=Paraburkholderia kururiensis TaxID=984307 RepID=A0ABZ0WNF9_9BURK|nr:hypothetical protein [Paraburkholderia kururiensis]WQD78907.1 hypothetical protein U0042_04140 [Paraburkholderia kururiensis]
MRHPHVRIPITPLADIKLLFGMGSHSRIRGSEERAVRHERRWIGASHAETPHEIQTEKRAKADMNRMSHAAIRQCNIAKEIREVRACGKPQRNSKRVTEIDLSGLCTPFDAESTNTSVNSSEMKREEWENE